MEKSKSIEYGGKKMNDNENLREIKELLIGRKIMDITDGIKGLKFCLSDGSEIELLTCIYPDGTYRSSTYIKEELKKEKGEGI